MRESRIGVGVIGAGGISRQVHLPGLQGSGLAEVVALCDSDPASLARTAEDFAVPHTFSDYQQLLAHPGLDAVVVATPTVLHAPVVLAALAAGKHVLCEKQLAMDYPEARGMYEAAEAAGLRHMTAFTYRFVPAMRYLKHLLAQGVAGTPRFLRVARLMDWPDTSIGWRQRRDLAGSGEIGDMGAHRIDFCHDLVGPVDRVVAQARTFVPERAGPSGPTGADVEDFAALLATFSPGAGVEQGAVATFTLSKVARGRGQHGAALDELELYGTEGTLIYHLHEPHHLQVGRPGGVLETIPVPREFLTYPGSPRDPHAGDPTVTFRYDQDFAFLQAIADGRSAVPSFYDGMRAQAVIDAALESACEGRWADVPGMPLSPGATSARPPDDTNPPPYGEYL